MPEITGRPEPEDELGEPEQEPQPPQVELSAAEIERMMSNMPLKMK